MKRTKEQRGITLIALIITIVVLLILAAVAISSIQNDGILHYAQNAADSWNKAAQNEAGILDSYLEYLNPCLEKGHTYGAWVTTKQAGDCLSKIDGSRERTCSECGFKETDTINWKHNAGGTDEESTCTVCGNDCAHVLESMFGGADITGHYFIYNCQRCGYSCPNDQDSGNHDFENSYCATCGFTCDHTMNGGESMATYEKLNELQHTVTCTICDLDGPQNHNFENETCKDCGYVKPVDPTNCEHSMSEGVCEICLYQCPAHGVNTYISMGSWRESGWDPEEHVADYNCSECHEYIIDDVCCSPGNRHPECTVCNP